MIIRGIRNKLSVAKYSVSYYLAFSHKNLKKCHRTSSKFKVSLLLNDDNFFFFIIGKASAKKLTKKVSKMFLSFFKRTCILSVTEVIKSLSKLALYFLVCVFKGGRCCTAICCQS